MSEELELELVEVEKEKQDQPREEVILSDILEKCDLILHKIIEKKKEVS